MMQKGCSFSDLRHAHWLRSRLDQDDYSGWRQIPFAGDGRTRQDPSRQYGTGGKMQGKKFMICATWNAPREAFDNPNGVLYAGKGTADLFLHITSNYKFTGYDILPDYGVFDIFKNPDIPRALEDYKRHLEKHCL